MTDTLTKLIDRLEPFPKIAMIRKALDHDIVEEVRIFDGTLHPRDINEAKFAELRTFILKAKNLLTSTYYYVEVYSPITGVNHREWIYVVCRRLDSQYKWTVLAFDGAMAIDYLELILGAPDERVDV